MTPTLQNSQDADQFLATEAQKLLEQAQKLNDQTQQTQQAQTGPLKVKVFGQELQFNSTDDLSAALERTLNQAAQVQQVVPQQTQQVVAPQITEDEDPWNFQHFVEQMTKDPREAIDYALQSKLGMTLDEVKNKLDSADTAAKVVHAEQFRTMHPEFPVNNRGIADALEARRAQMGLPFNAQGLEAAYFMSLNHDPNFRAVVEQNARQIQAVNAARIQQSQQQQQQSQYQFPQEPGLNENPYLAPPPSVSRVNAGNKDSVDFESLSISQLEALAKSFESRR